MYWSQNNLSETKLVENRIIRKIKRKCKKKGLDIKKIDIPFTRQLLPSGNCFQIKYSKEDDFCNHFLSHFQDM